MDNEVKKTPEELRKEMFDNISKNPEVLHEIAMPGVKEQVNKDE